MEEDTGKSLHVGGATGRIHGAAHSLLDYNRAGIPLIEIVTKPIEGTGALAPQVAKAYVTELRELMQALGVSDARMEQGQMRCDVNLSLRPAGGEVRHPLRDQERQLAALRRAGRPLRDPAARRACCRPAARSSRRPGTSTRTPAPRPPGRSRRRPRTTGTSRSPTSCRSRRTRRGSRSCGPGCPSRRRCAAASCRTRGALRPRHAVRCSTPAPSTSSRATIDAGAPRRGRPQVVDGRAGPAGQRAPGRPRRAGRSPRSRSPGWPRWSTSGALNDKLARQVIEGVLAGEGDPGRGRREPRPEGRLRRRRAARGRRRGDRRQPGRRRQDPRRQGRRGRRAGRRGHEGDPRPGRRRPGPRADPGALRAVLKRSAARSV